MITVTNTQPGLTRDFRARCEKIATEQRQLLSLQPHEPLPGELLSELHHVVMHTPETLPGATPEMAANLLESDSWDGLLLHIPLKTAIILLRSNLPPARRESTIMHEIAHLLLAHPTVNFDPISGIPIRQKQYEDEAAYLGGCLQIPHRALVWAKQIGLNVSRTAKNFGASEKMVIYRANITYVRLPK